MKPSLCLITHSIPQDNACCLFLNSSETRLTPVCSVLFYILISKIIFFYYTSHFVCRRFVKVTISRLKILLPWLMEKPCGVCLIITSGRNFIVPVLTMYCLNHFLLCWSCFTDFQSFWIIVVICSQDPNERNGKKSIISATDCTDAAHNFILSQKLTTLLGNFPEVNIQHMSSSNSHPLWSIVIWHVFMHYWTLTVLCEQLKHVQNTSRQILSKQNLKDDYLKIWLFILYWTFREFCC